MRGSHYTDIRQLKIFFSYEDAEPAIDPALRTFDKFESHPHHGFKVVNGWGIARVDHDDHGGILWLFTPEGHETYSSFVKLEIDSGFKDAIVAISGVCAGTKL